METYDLDEAAERSGIDVHEIGRFVELGVLTPAAALAARMSTGTRA